ncbi:MULTISPECIES: hypothetical protein [unclassified Oleiphilus]|uniref:hypothetical protein n=1 Tax=unclassified Oleiphilus TaxID=2631174 RepID=UPI0007C2E933|nr:MULTISPECIES: hypothetical protein [unclassified Oleiphilus]KZZ37874.1 hypothetical protein A3757_09625 [Oleiphilus sp. HI0117]KZZ52348.1 hypothetical protein A3761_19225 [Oleiphilus sp. HI0123]
MKLVNSISNKYRLHIREKAIQNSKNRILLAGKDERDFSREELESIVREEEDKLYDKIKNMGLFAVMSAFGISLWG